MCYILCMFYLVFISLFVLSSIWTVYSYWVALKQRNENDPVQTYYPAYARVFGFTTFKEALERIWEEIKRACISLIFPIIFSAHAFILAVDHVIDDPLIVPDYFLRNILVHAPDVVRAILIGILILFALGTVLYSFFVVASAFSRFSVRYKDNILVLQNGRTRVARIDLAKPFTYDLREYSTGSPVRTATFVAVHETIVFQQGDTHCAVSFANISRTLVTPGKHVVQSPLVVDGKIVVYEPEDGDNTLRKQLEKSLKQKHATRAS